MTMPEQNTPSMPPAACDVEPKAERSQGAHLRDMRDEAKQKVSEAKREVTDRARRLAVDTRERIASGARSAAESGKQGVTSSCRDVRDALQCAADTLRERNDTRVANYVSGAADGVEKAAKYIEERSPDEMARDAGNVVRHNPAIVLGGLFAAGLLVGRFLRASAPERDEEMSGISRGVSQGMSAKGSYGGRTSAETGISAAAGYGAGSGEAGSMSGEGSLGLPPTTARPTGGPGSGFDTGAENTDEDRSTL